MTGWLTLKFDGLALAALALPGNFAAKPDGVIEGDWARGRRH